MKKLCTKCGATKEEAAFYKRKATGGLFPYCKACSRGRSKSWYERNRARSRARARKWRSEHQARARATTKTYEDNNPRRWTQWRRDNPERARALSAVSNHARRARKQGSGGKHTVAEVQRIYELQRGRCALCKAKVALKKMHREHIMSLALGGTNDIINIQLACRSCNLKKGAKDPIKFAQLNGRLL